MLISRTNSRGQILPPFESSVGWAVPSGRLARPTLAPCSLPSMLTCAQTSPPSLPPFVRGATGGRVASDQPLRHRCSPGPPPVPVKFLEISHRCSSRTKIAPSDSPPFASLVGWAVPTLRLARPTLAPCSLPSMLTCAQTPPPSLPPFRKGGPGGVKPRVTSPYVIDAHPARHSYQPNSSRFPIDAHRAQELCRQILPPFVRGGQGGSSRE